MIGTISTTRGTLAYNETHALQIVPDDDHGEGPREWDNLGTMVCFHRKYDLGDRHDLREQDFESWAEVEAYLYRELDASVVLPLYLYDHGVLRMKVGSFQGLLPQGHAEFDSDQVGFVYVSRSKLREEYSVKRVTKRVREQAARVLADEVAVYDQYLSGDVWGFELYRIDRGSLVADGFESVRDAAQAGSLEFYLEEEDSCWGFYGSDPTENGMDEHLSEHLDLVEAAA